MKMIAIAIRSLSGWANLFDHKLGISEVVAKEKGGQKDFSPAGGAIGWKDATALLQSQLALNIVELPESSLVPSMFFFRT